MTREPFFRDTKKIVLALTGSTDTREVDFYRQGVEITMPKHWAGSAYKIYSGEEDHSWFAPGRGHERIHRKDENIFLDETTDPDPSWRIASASVETTPSTPDEGVQVKQGVIDVFEKRDDVRKQRISFSGVRCSFSNSSESVNERSVESCVSTDVVDTKRSDKNARFYDYERLTVVNTIRVKNEKRRSTEDPYEDTRQKTSAYSGRYSRNDLFGYVTGSSNYNSDSRLPPGKNSSTVGFVYNNSVAGTDSVTHGGLLES